jgi:deoxyribodipyrimidine photo-lyase
MGVLFFYSRRQPSAPGGPRAARAPLAVLRMHPTTVKMLHLVWYKRDLRTIDHAPLVEASRAGAVLPLYGVETEYWRQPETSARQWIAIRAALSALNERLNQLGAPLVLKMGDICDILRQIHAQHGIAAIHTHEETGNAFTFDRDKKVRAFCREHGIALHEYRQFGVIRPLKNRNDWSRLHHRQMAAPIVPEPQKLEPVMGIDSEALPSAAALGLEPDGCANPQPGTRAEAWRMLESFLGGRGAHYRKGMSSPLSGEHACSRLSVPLSTGAISIREVFQRCYKERQTLSEIPPACRSL